MSKRDVPLPVVLVDTREQLPYDFPGFPVIRKALPSGDYSILGHEHCFAIERKSHEDLLGCIFEERFYRELMRLREFKHAFLVIEAPLWKIARGHSRSKANPASVIGKLQAISVYYGVHVMYLDSREHAQAYCRGLIQKYYRMLLRQEGKNNDQAV